VNENRDDWDQHWKEYSQTAEENPAQNYRRAMVLSFLGGSSPDTVMRVLDIGSGQGDMAADVRAHFPTAEVMGLELSQAGVEISRRKVPGARFVQRNLLETMVPPENQRHWATHAICMEVLEHLEDPAALLRNAREYMAED
jgi:2-polyprenyl-3-methyl-5-hydroxy-6-metoxy-1,4-benzoquinol methylase